MSTTTKQYHRFFVYAPDKTDEGAHERRYAVRPRHFEAVQPLIDSGVIQVGGMVVSEDQIESEGGQKKAVASLLIVKAKTIDDARKLIESDVYYTSGVWDSEKLIILPFIPATPFP